jgi:hypothetical protein
MAAAKVEVRFIESAPKDSFVIVNNGQCDLKDFVFEVDLTSTSGKLIFDTTGSGAGVEVFQPFESREGNLTLASGDSVADGDKTVSVRGALIPIKKKVSFTIDVDDTLKNSELRQIRVTGSEMQGGKVSLSANNVKSVSASFDAKNGAQFEASFCGS